MGLRRDLLKDMGVLLLREENLTLEKAEELVKLQETTLRMMQGRGANTRVSRVAGQREECFNCGKPGHIETTGQERKGNVKRNIPDVSIAIWRDIGQEILRKEERVKNLEEERQDRILEKIEGLGSLENQKEICPSEE